MELPKHHFRYIMMFNFKQGRNARTTTCEIFRDYEKKLYIFIKTFSFKRIEVIWHIATFNEAWYDVQILVSSVNIKIYFL